MCSSSRVCRDSVGGKNGQFFTGSGRRTLYVRYSRGFSPSPLAAMSIRSRGRGSCVWFVERWHVILAERVRVRCSEVSFGIRDTGPGVDSVPRDATTPNAASPCQKHLI